MLSTNNYYGNLIAISVLSYKIRNVMMFRNYVVFLTLQKLYKLQRAFIYGFGECIY